MAQIIYPIGIQTFSKIREGGLLYIDKTEYVYRLVNTSQFVFLSRPRRFGKSLLLSTVKEYFLGHRNLFEGLEISRCERDWVKHPVLHLDFTGADYNDPSELYTNLDVQFAMWENEYEIEKLNDSLSSRFREIILRAYKKAGQKVVILIDEYDKPLLETVDNPELQQKYRETLRGIYGNLKRMDEYIRFAMLTGVTKFGHLSIFSDLNNLNDISFDEQFEGICGITGKELRCNLSQGVAELAERTGQTVDEAYETLKRNYDGYRFSPEGCLDVYNPFSLLSALSKCKIGNYWFKTGTPTFLIKMIKADNLPIIKLDKLHATVEELTDLSFNLGNYIPVMYQSGYLTIKDYDSELGEVTLGFPNKEVESGFLNQVMPLYTSVPEQRAGFEIIQFVKDVRAGRAEEFMMRLQSLFADFQYDSFDLKHLEQHYQGVIFIVFKLMGFYTRTEYKTASGRIDMVIKTKDYIYVIEFKIDKSAKEALAQIDTKEYLLPFKADGRKLVKIGVNFDSKTRTIASWIID